MKKILLLLVSIFIICFIVISLIVKNDNKYMNKLISNILDNTDLLMVEYVNYYDGYYIVRDTDKLYLFNNKYVEILSINLSLLFNKYDKYDIVYRNNALMYMSEDKNKEGIVFKYYDIYTGECIDEVIMGGFYE